MINGLSLFANVGIAETYLKEVGVDIKVANELLPERAKFYSHLYPDCNMICGDITDKDVFENVKKASIDSDVKFLLATPPCQGMSLNGKKDPNDIRNNLIMYAIKAVKEIEPTYFLFENVSQQLKTRIIYKGKPTLIPDIIRKELGKDYEIKMSVLNTKNYSVPQSRERCFTIAYKKNSDLTWDFPIPDDRIITLEEAIGHLPSVYPLCKEDGHKSKIDFNNYHYPPVHCKRHIEMMEHTPTGESAFKNDVYYPKKESGERISGGAYAYMRMSWDKPAPTVTQNNGVISSFTNVHPGRALGNGTYSDPRVLTIKELLIVTSLPEDWSIPTWATEKLVRNVIGEAIPPMIVKKIVNNLTEQLND